MTCSIATQLLILNQIDWESTTQVSCIKAWNQSKRFITLLFVLQLAASYLWIQWTYSQYNCFSLLLLNSLCCWYYLHYLRCVHGYKVSRQQMSAHSKHYISFIRTIISIVCNFLTGKRHSTIFTKCSFSNRARFISLLPHDNTTVLLWL